MHRPRSLWLGSFAAALIFALPLAGQTTAEDYFRRGSVSEQQRDFFGAMADFDKAVELNPRFAEALTSRGALKRLQGDLAGAIADYDQAIAANPKHIMAYNNRGNARRARGDLDGALADFDRAIAIKPDYANALVNRAGLKAARADFGGAIADYDKAIAAKPDHAVAYNNRGNAKLGNGDLKGAISDFSRDLELNPGNSSAYLGRGIARNASGDFSRAVADYTRAIDLAKTEIAYAWVYRQLTLRRLHHDEPKPSLVEAMAGWKNNWMKTIARYLTGDLPESELLATAGTTDVGSAHGRQCEAYYFVAMVHLLQGDPSGARRFLEQCVATKEATYTEFTLARNELERVPAER